ncbi:MAG: hypothetical protein HY608_06510, partial [Planctomycetes bacterium]|nr:hypothetical protein [Planctomycetota bacterium]
AWDGQVVLARAEDLATPDITLRAELQTGLDGVSDAHLPTGQPVVDARGPSVFDPSQIGRRFFVNGQILPQAGLSPWGWRVENSTNSGLRFPCWERYGFVGYDASLPPAENNLSLFTDGSIECWVRPVWRPADATQCGQTVWHLHFGTPNKMRLQVQDADCVVGIFYYDGGFRTKSIRFPLTSLPVDWDEPRRWHHLRVTWRHEAGSAIVSLYADGIQTPGSPADPIPSTAFPSQRASPAEWTPLELSFLTEDASSLMSAPSHPMVFLGSLGRLAVSSRGDLGDFPPTSICEPSDVSLEPFSAEGPDLARFESAPIPLPLGSVLESVAWTGYLAEGSKLYLSVDPGDGVWRPQWTWDGTSWVWPAWADTDGAPIPLGIRLDTETDPAGNPGKALVRYRTVFTTRPGATTVREGPILDDVTLTYTLPGGPTLLRYRSDGGEPD